MMMWTGVFGSGDSDDELCHGGDNNDYFGDADWYV